jgi:hypothetical protein
MTHDHHGSALVRNGVEALQAITFANALRPMADLPSTRALQEDDLPAARGARDLSELEQDFQRFWRDAALLHPDPSMRTFLWAPFLRGHWLRA